MKELLEYIVKSIANNPDSVVVTEKESVDFPGLTILSINVSEEDKGIIIGKRGRTINAIRDIMSINAIRSNARVRVLVEENKENRDENKEISPSQPEVIEEIEEDGENIFDDDL